MATGFLSSNVGGVGWGKAGKETGVLVGGGPNTPPETSVGRWVETVNTATKRHFICITNKDPVQHVEHLLKVMLQPGWEGSLGENGYTYMYWWVPLLFTWDSLNIVNQLYLNTKLKVLSFFKSSILSQTVNSKDRERDHKLMQARPYPGLHSMSDSFALFLVCTALSY